VGESKVSTLSWRDYETNEKTACWVDKNDTTRETGRPQTSQNGLRNIMENGTELATDRVRAKR
jgi:hypothetical protein